MQFLGFSHKVDPGSFSQLTSGTAALLFIAAVAASTASQAAENVKSDGGQATDISQLTDEFDGRSLSRTWSQFHHEYGWPSKIKVLDVGAITTGALHLQPYSSAWVRDLHAPFLYKTLQGDFDVRARVRVRGLKSDIPGGTWSLGGLMARVPNRSTAENWEPRAENWNFITTGVGHEPGKVMIETKATYNSNSSLKLRPHVSGWVELRLVRVGMSTFALAREGGDGRWRVRDRFYRMDAPPAVQVGLIAYTTSPDIPQRPERPETDNQTVERQARVDMALDVDWIRFQRPQPQPIRNWYSQVNGTNPLTDPNLPEAEVLRLLGD